MFNLNDGLLYSGLITFSDEWQANLAYLICAVAVIAVSYLLGSVNSAIIISKVFYNDDIRNHGSGNAGLTNVNRTYGLKAAGLTLLGDMLKSVLSVLFAAVLFGFHYIDGISVSEFCYIAGLFAVLGHVFPIYYGFKGGKGVLYTATVALVLSPSIFLVLFTIFVVIVAISKYVSLGSVMAAVSYIIFILGYMFGERSFNVVWLVTASLMAILLIAKHHANIKRLLNGTESKLFSKKEKDK